MTGRPVTLCIVNHNGATHLVGALEAAATHASELAEVLVVDDASTDDSPSIAQSRFPHVRICRLPGNRGPGAARNAGWTSAANDLILFQDNDVRLTRDCLATLAGTLAAHPRALLVAPRVLYAHDPQLIQYDSADCHVLGLMVPRNANRSVSECAADAQRTTSVVTACFLVDRRRWSGPAPFDAELGFNLEDHDFGVRSNVWGHETWVEPRACVLHGAGTAGLSYRPGYATNSKRMFCLIRNRWWIIARSYSARAFLLLLPLLLTYEVYQIAGVVRHGWWREWAAAFASTVRHSPQLVRTRAAVQTRRVVRDACILRPGPLPLTGALRASRLEQAALRFLERSTNAYWKRIRALVE